MNDLKVFQSSEFGEIGILIIDGKEYFPATACAKILGHENPQRAIRKFCKGVTKTVTPSSGGAQEVNYIPEGDLYRLIIRSKLPSAERFERWIFDEVLPALRKNGHYGSPIGEKELITEVAKETAAAVMSQIPQIISEALRDTFEAFNTFAPEMRNSAEFDRAYRENLMIPKRTKMETFPPTLLRQVNEILDRMDEEQALNISFIVRFCAMNGHSISHPAVKKYYELRK